MIHSTQVCIPLKPLFSRHKGAGVQFTDEPTGNLDKKTETEIINLLYKSAHEMGKCVIVVTHSSILAERADQIVKLEDGKAYKVK